MNIDDTEFVAIPWPAALGQESAGAGEFLLEGPLETPLVNLT
jgi:hypothetical protein